MARATTVLNEIRLPSIIPDILIIKSGLVAFLTGTACMTTDFRSDGGGLCALYVEETRTTSFSDSGTVWVSPSLANVSAVLIGISVEPFAKVILRDLSDAL